MNAKLARKIHQSLFMLIVLIFISGCASKEPNAPGATVTEEQAIAIAQENMA